MTKTAPLWYFSDEPIINGLGLSGSHTKVTWPRYVRITDIASPTSLRTDVFASQPPEVASRADVQENDILFASVGATVGKSVRIGKIGDACFAGYLTRVRPRAEAESRYLAYWAQSLDFWGQISVGTVKTTVENFSAGRYRKMHVPCYGEATQRTIADYLDRETGQIDAMIGTLDELEKTLGERQDEVLRSFVFTGGRAGEVDSGYWWIGQIPADYQVVPIRLVTDMKTGHTPSRNNRAYWHHVTIPWFTLADVWQLRHGVKYISETKQKISQVGLNNSSAELLPKGTVLLSRTASVGFTGIADMPLATSQDYWNWVCGPKIIPEYLWYQFRAMRGYFSSLTLGSTHRTIYEETAGGLRIVLPSLSEQRRIVDHLDEVSGKIDAMLAKVSELKSLLTERRAALITEVVTGQKNIV